MAEENIYHAEVGPGGRARAPYHLPVAYPLPGLLGLHPKENSRDLRGVSVTLRDGDGRSFGSRWWRIQDGVASPKLSCAGGPTKSQIYFLFLRERRDFGCGGGENAPPKHKKRPGQPGT
eukprot:471744-Amorphochlora_amoeboformis.AAC.1